VLAVLWSVFIS